MERKKLADLEKWLKSPRRKPLVIWGARQVGKTYLVEELFAKRYFKDYIYIDLKKDSQARSFFSTTSNADDYLTYIEARYGKKPSSEILLIFDEVQQCHQVLSALKYFCQDHRELPVIATGSLVRLSIKQQETKHSSDEFLFPVGKIDSMTVYPVSFEEYLMNVNPVILKMIQESYSTKTALKEPYFEMAMDLLHEYLTIGGLPEA
ncbi:MAG: AAA family ATPase, partial [Treponema sp.]|nr:AAA family ATPase [Treponema sp.]